MSSGSIDEFCQTIYCENKYTIKWIIDKPCIRVLRPQTSINSFEPDKRWWLQLSNELPNRQVNDGMAEREDIVLYLMPKSTRAVTCDLFVMKSAGITQIASGVKYRMIGKERKIQICFPSKEQLLDDSSDWFVDNKLTLICEITEVCEPITTSVQGLSQALKASEYQVINDLSELFESGKGSDVVLETNKREFKAHKAILMARSVVFSAMFGHTMEEKITNRVVIKDIDSEVIHAMLAFIYTGRVGDLRELGADLLAAADKYGLDQLKTICEDSLYSNITTENAIQVLLLSDSLKANKLKTLSIDFITKNAKDVMKTEDWKILPDRYPNLMEEIILYSPQK